MSFFKYNYYFEAEQMWSDDPSTRVYITVATAVAEGQVIQEIKRRSNVSYDEYGKAHRQDNKYSSKAKDH